MKMHFNLKLSKPWAISGDDLCAAGRNCLERITFAAAFTEVTAKPARNERSDSSFQMVS